MDESKLSDLLRDAVADVPPPTFDQRDVVRESDRQVNRRNKILTGSAFGVAILAGAAALSVALWTGTYSAEQTSSAGGDAATGNEMAAPNELPSEGRDAPPAESRDDQSSSPESRKQGRTPAEDAGPAGPGSTSSGCEQADRELAAALAGELPAAAQVRAEDAVPVDSGCAPNARGATFRVPGGTITTIVLPPDTPNNTQLAGTSYEQAEVLTSDGNRVLVISAAPGTQTPPYVDYLDEWAARVAQDY